MNNKFESLIKMKNPQYGFNAINHLCVHREKRRVVKGITCKSVHRSDILPDCCEELCPYMNGVELK